MWLESLHTKKRSSPLHRTELAILLNAPHIAFSTYIINCFYYCQSAPSSKSVVLLDMSNPVVSPVPGVEILGPVSNEAKSILTNEAVSFLASLHRNFNATRKQLLKKRQLRQQQIDAGVMLDFLPETKHIRDDDTWRAAKPAPGLEDRRVEITGPVDRKMVSHMVQQASNCRLSMLSTAMSRLIWQILKVFRLSGRSKCQIPKRQCGRKC